MFYEYRLKITEVKANSVKDFVLKYYKKERLTNTMIETKEREFKNFGYCTISHHDSNTAKIVRYFGNKEVLK